VHEVILKRFEQPDEGGLSEGKVEIVNVGVADDWKGNVWSGVESGRFMSAGDGRQECAVSKHIGWAVRAGLLRNGEGRINREEAGDFSHAPGTRQLGSRG